MKIDASQNNTFKSTKIRIARNKTPFMKYIDALPPKIYKTFAPKSVEECLPELKSIDNALGILIGKDRCFYIFGKNQAQDEFIYHRIKKIDSDAQYIKDVID